MAWVRCKNHQVGGSGGSLAGTQEDCIDCVRATRDLLEEEVEKLLETPTSKVFEDYVDPFIAKMSSRGVTLVTDPAVRYHLALLIKKLLKETE